MGSGVNSPFYFQALLPPPAAQTTTTINFLLLLFFLIYKFFSKRKIMLLLRPTGNYDTMTGIIMLRLLLLTAASFTLLEVIS